MDIILLNSSCLTGMRSSGPYRIATELRKHGYSVKVIDYVSYMTIQDTSLLKQFLSKYITNETLWIGISSTYFWNFRNNEKMAASAPVNKVRSNLDITHEELMDLRNFIKTLNPKCQIVCGGARAFTLPDPHFFDTYILGFAETHVIDYTKYLKGKNPFFQFQVHNEKMIVNYDIKAERFDFNHSDIDWSGEYLEYGESLPIEISRGCIFRCKFCRFLLNGKSKFDYIKDVSSLKNELIKNYEQFGTKTYVFSDDTYNDSTFKVDLLYNEVFSKLPFKINFTCYLRLDLMAAHPEQIALLKESGIIGAFFGIESLNHDANKSVGKGITEEKIIETLHNVRNVWGNEINTSAGFIIGLPNDTEHDIIRWLNIVKDQNFPIHSKAIYPLSIATRRELGEWESEFQKNSDKYGYIIDHSIDSSYSWTNTQTGMTGKRALEIAKEYFKYITPSRYGAFLIPGLMNCGYSMEEAINLTNSSENHHEFTRRQTIMRENYWKKLLNE